MTVVQVQTSISWLVKEVLHCVARGGEAEHGIVHKDLSLVCVVELMWQLLLCAGLRTPRALLPWSLVTVVQVQTSISWLVKEVLHCVARGGEAQHGIVHKDLSLVCVVELMWQLLLCAGLRHC